FFHLRPPPSSTLFPYTTLFRSHLLVELEVALRIQPGFAQPPAGGGSGLPGGGINPATGLYDPDPVFWGAAGGANGSGGTPNLTRSEEHTSELQSRSDLVCRLLL